jgi:DHA2 family multidrug resistance protein
MMTSGLIEWTGLFLGFGQSLIFNPIAILAYVTLVPMLRTEGTAFSTMFRTLGGSIGIALMQAGLVHQSAVAHEALTSTLSPADTVDRWAAPSMLGGEADLLALSAEVTRQALMIAYSSMFAWMCLGSLVLIPLTLLLKTSHAPTSGKPFGYRRQAVVTSVQGK